MLLAKRRLASALVLVALAVGDYTRAQPRPNQPQDPAAAGTSHRGAARPMSAAFTWSVPERYSSSWAAWDAASGTYARSYTAPDSWRIELNACASHGGGQAISSYAWVIKGVSNPSFSRSRTTSACQLRLSLPDQGQYHITLSITTSGAATASVSHDVKLKDWLIVSIGDSFSSGEGNPDRAGDFRPVGALRNACKGVVVGDAVRQQVYHEVNKRALWKDRTCHRSALSGPALAAEHIERSDDKSSVTFISLACSGAEIDHLTHLRYKGKEPDDDTTRLPPQLIAVRSAVGSRPIDALVVSIGINDLHFSDVMTACGHPVNAAQGVVWSDDSCPGRKMDVRLAGLARKYKQLSDDIKTLLIAKEIYIIGYPVNLMERSNGDRHVCECLDVYNSGINNNDFNALGYVGRRLNIAVANAARVHGWSYISGVTEAFAGRGYCEDGGSRFFRRVRESVKMQGKEHGGVHPNEKGHRAIRDLLVASVKLDTNTNPTHRVTVMFTKVKVGKVDSGRQRTLNLTLQIAQRHPQPFHDFAQIIPPIYERIAVEEVPNGRWTDLPPGKYQFSFDLHSAPNPARYVSDFDIKVLGNGKGLRLEALAALAPSGMRSYTLTTPDQIEDGFGVQVLVSATPLR